tara:strand:- start:42 stop:836 length:795 start_codon:yes stop_codon:yes gene_type:complete
MECVKIICDKYDLNKGDVVDMLLENGVKLKGSIKHFPWNGTKMDGCCEGIKYCGGLFIQCKQKVNENGNYCSFCYKQSQQNEHGKPSAGTISDRMNVGPLEYVDPKGRKVIPFSTYMRKKKIDKEIAQIEAKINNIQIDEEQFTEVTVKRGRPKNSKGTVKNTHSKKKSDSSEVSSIEEVEENTTNNNDRDEDGDHEDDDHEDDDHEDGDHEDDDDENVESVEVEEFEYNNVTYFKAESGQVFNEESEMVGIWDSNKNIIIFNS